MLPGIKPTAASHVRAVPNHREHLTGHGVGRRGNIAEHDGRFVRGKLIFPRLGCLRGFRLLRTAGFQCSRGDFTLALGFRQPSVGLVHGCLNQPHPRLHGFRLALQTLGGFGACLQAIFHVLRLLPRGVQTVVLRKQRLMSLGLIKTKRRILTVKSTQKITKAMSTRDVK